MRHPIGPTTPHVPTPHSPLPIPLHTCLYTFLYLFYLDFVKGYHPQPLTSSTYLSLVSQDHFPLITSPLLHFLFFTQKSFRSFFLTETPIHSNRNPKRPKSDLTGAKNGREWIAVCYPRLTIGLVFLNRIPTSPTECPPLSDGIQITEHHVKARENNLNGGTLETQYQK
jgi:hypothetical protein